MQFLAIVLLCILAAVLYGIVHDLVTASICVEYFTIGHPDIFHTTSPTLLALGWGVLATWWAGLIIGFPLALSARLGPWPKRSWRDLLQPVSILLAVMAVLAFLAGFVGHKASIEGAFRLMPPLSDRIPPDRHTAFLTAAAAHAISYASGFLGGLVLALVTLVSRVRKGHAP